MSENVSVRELVAVVAGPREWSDTRESWLARAARRAGLNHRTVKALYYGEISDERHPAARLLRIEAQRRAARTNAYAATLDNAADALERIDPEMHQHDIDTLRHLARSVRDLD